MSDRVCTLYGTTSISGSVPNERCAGPVFSPDGRLVLAESFAALSPVDHAWFQAGLNHLLATDDFVEAWRIWDCETASWAPLDLVLYRFEEYDLVVRHSENAVCSWQGSLDTRARVLSSRSEDDYAKNCWQWLRWTS